MAQASEATRCTAGDVLSFVDEALSRNRARVLEHFHKSESDGEDARLTHADLHNLLLGCLPKGEVLYRREARLFLALVDPEGRGSVGTGELGGAVKSALQMREELSLGKYVTSTPPSDRGVTWESVRTLLAQRLTSKAASQASMFDIKEPMRVYSDWERRTSGGDAFTTEPTSPGVDALGVTAVIKAAVPHIERDDLRWLVTHVFMTNHDNDGLLTYLELATALKLAPAATLRVRSEWTIDHGGAYHTAAASRCLRALITASEGALTASPWRPKPAAAAPSPRPPASSTADSNTHGRKTPHEQSHAGSAPPLPAYTHHAPPPVQLQPSDATHPPPHPPPRASSPGERFATRGAPYGAAADTGRRGGDGVHHSSRIGGGMGGHHAAYGDGVRDPAPPRHASLPPLPATTTDHQMFEPPGLRTLPEQHETRDFSREGRVYGSVPPSPARNYFTGPPDSPASTSAKSPTRGPHGRAGSVAMSVAGSSAMALEYDSFDSCVQALATYSRQHQVRVRQLVQHYSESQDGRLSPEAVERLVCRLLIKITPEQLLYVRAMLTLDDTLHMDFGGWMEALGEAVAALSGMEHTHLRRIQDKAALLLRSSGLPPAQAFAEAGRRRPGQVERGPLVRILQHQAGLNNVEARGVIHYFFEHDEIDGGFLTWPQTEELLGLTSAHTDRSNGFHHRGGDSFAAPSAAPPYAAAAGAYGREPSSFLPPSHAGSAAAYGQHEVSIPDSYERDHHFRAGARSHYDYRADPWDARVQSPAAAVSTYQLEQPRVLSKNAHAFEPASAAVMDIALPEVRSRWQAELREPVWQRVQQSVPPELWAAVRDKLRSYMQ